MAMASSSGEVRRRKNPQKANPDASHPSSPPNNFNSPTHQKRRRPENNHEQYSDDNGNFRSSSGSPNASNAASIKKEYDEYAWFAVFLMALSYFIVTRGGQSSRGGVLSSFSKPYHVVSSSVAVAVAEGNKEKSEKLLRSIFYIEKSQKDENSLMFIPNHRLEVILSSPPDLFNIVGVEESVEECTYNNEVNNQNQNSIPYLSHLSSTTWVHDEELGRGYLLLADAGRSGRIWRWEVGGGPITIGRSLNMERSGCRSGLWVNADGKNIGNGTCPENLFGDSSEIEKGKMSCSKSSTSDLSASPPLLGSASLAVELTRNAERSTVGANIVVAEWGEKRIVRVEGETGARTPLVVLVPHPSVGEEHQQHQQWRRVVRPNHLTYTPFGDLLFSDNFLESGSIPDDNAPYNVGVVYRRREAVHVLPIPAEQSRDAHGWTAATDGGDHGIENIDVLFQTRGFIEGMALGADLSTLFVFVTTETVHFGKTKRVYKVRLSADEDDQDSDDGGIDKAGDDDDEFAVFHEMNATDCESDVRDPSNGSKLTVDEKGTVYLIECPSSVTLLDKEDGNVVGTLTLDKLQTQGKYPSLSSPLTSISFGEDGYLYITSPSELMRIKSRVEGMPLPTNLVVPPPSKKA